MRCSLAGALLLAPGDGFVCTDALINNQFLISELPMVGQLVDGNTQRSSLVVYCVLQNLSSTCQKLRALSYYTNRFGDKLRSLVSV